MVVRHAFDLNTGEAEARLVYKGSPGQSGLVT